MQIILHNCRLWVACLPPAAAGEFGNYPDHGADDSDYDQYADPNAGFENTFNGCAAVKQEQTEREE